MQIYVGKISHSSAAMENHIRLAFAPIRSWPVKHIFFTYTHASLFLTWSGERFLRPASEKLCFLDDRTVGSGCAVHCGPLWSGVCKTLGLPLLGLALLLPLQTDTQVCFQPLTYELLAVHSGTFPNPTFISEILEALKTFRCSLHARKFFFHMWRSLLAKPLGMPMCIRTVLAS